MGQVVHVCITFAHQIAAATKDNSDTVHSFCFAKMKGCNGSTKLKEQYSSQPVLQISMYGLYIKDRCFSS